MAAQQKSIDLSRQSCVIAPMKVYTFRFLLISLAITLMTSLAGCSDEDVKDSLKDYVDHHSLSVHSSPVLSCATGITSGFLGSAENPISILFYPIPGAKNIKYFETDKDDIESKDYSLYQLKELKQEPLMNGYMGRFLRSGQESKIWGIVVYETDTNLHVSGPVRLN